MQSTDTMTSLEQTLGYDIVEMIGKYLGPKDYNNLREATPGLKAMLPIDKLIPKLKNREKIMKVQILRTNIMMREIWKRMEVRPDGIDWGKFHLNYDEQLLPQLIAVLQEREQIYKDAVEEHEDILIPWRPGMNRYPYPTPSVGGHCEDTVYKDRAPLPHTVKISEYHNIPYNLMHCFASLEVIMVKPTHVLINDDTVDMIFQLALWPRGIRDHEEREIARINKFTMAAKINNGVRMRFSLDEFKAYIRHMQGIYGLGQGLFTVYQGVKDQLEQILNWTETDFCLTARNLQRLGDEKLARELEYKLAYAWPFDLPNRWMYGRMEEVEWHGVRVVQCDIEVIRIPRPDDDENDEDN